MKTRRNTDKPIVLWLRVWPLSHNCLTPSQKSLLLLLYEVFFLDLNGEQYECQKHKNTMQLDHENRGHATLWEIVKTLDIILFPNHLSIYSIWCKFLNSCHPLSASELRVLNLWWQNRSKITKDRPIPKLFYWGSLQNSTGFTRSAEYLVIDIRAIVLASNI